MNPATAFLLTFRTLLSRPRRTAVLLLGYGLGVGVMVALLAVGDALLLQARDRDVVAGGDVVLLPEGVDPEVLKVGGVTGMYLEIPNARYLVRQILLGPRYAPVIAAVSPEVTDRVVYVRVRGKVYAVRANGILPSAAHRTRSALAVPGWEDTAEDRAWLSPDSAALLAEMDRFHAPSGPAWAEWWYFNFAAGDGTYGYLSFIADARGEAAVGATVRLGDGGLVRWTDRYRARALPFGGSSGPLRFEAGPHRAELRGGSYRVRVRRVGFAADLEITPVPGLYFPPVEWRSGSFRSGYTVPALRAEIKGEMRIGARVLPVRGTAYHDHNWGNWTGVRWEWGSASTANHALLYGLVRHPSLRNRETLVALYATRPRSGLLSVLRGTVPVREDGRSAPTRLRFRAANDARDTLTAELEVLDAIPTSTGRTTFWQLRTRYRIRGVVADRPVAVDALGFAETFTGR
ncbi:MAG: hypothetical protein QN193_09690 [Armatimonadota bacterium]|nr:hypothetical protein [Armatimonadota bacterium]MDR7443174.1 hypothetical protein [Armatimonadota bacterium]MDR7570866.1 hypothetical protein [Armatimonadota bacterium]MDR7614610.1 hypothetical protein [Armatimonadota bacterium]